MMNDQGVVIVDGQSVNENGHVEIEVMDFEQKEDSNNPKDYPISMEMFHSEVSTKWSKSDEKIINQFIYKCFAYQKLYNNSYFRYLLYYRLVNWPLVIVTCLSIGWQIITSTFTFSSFCDERNGIFSIITATLSIIVAILTYLQNKSSFMSNASGCKKASIAFFELADKLKTILSIARENRAKPYVVITSIHNDYQKLLKLYSDYIIPTDIYDSFIKKNKNYASLIDFSPEEIKEEYSTTLDKNIIIDRFLDSISNIREKLKDNNEIKN
jgi:hypothetical protein